MDFVLNFGLAWISVILVLALSIIYFLRKIIIKSNGKHKLLISLNKKLRKFHKHLGILLVLTGLIHGLFSSESVFSLNLGTVAWIISILLGVNWMARKALLKYKGWIYYHRSLTAVFILSIVFHVVEVGGVQAHILLLGGKTTSSEKFTTNEVNKPIEGATFKDGVYSGEADAFRPGLKVSVELKNNSIISIEIAEHNEVNSRYYQKAFDAVPQAILDNQTTNVDTISGATFTSIGIMNAVNNALSEALIEGTLPSTQELPQNRGHGKGGRDRTFDFERQ